jgi:hypothetical protein
MGIGIFYQTSVWRKKKMRHLAVIENLAERRPPQKAAAAKARKTKRAA